MNVKERKIQKEEVQKFYHNENVSNSPKRSLNYPRIVSRQNIILSR